MVRNLKYLYLIFSSPDVLSSNDYVFNSGRHPLKIPEHTVKGLSNEVDLVSHVRSDVEALFAKYNT